MDPRRFDSLTRSLTGTGTRRGLLRLLAAVPVAGAVLSLVAAEDAAGRGNGAIVGGGGGKRHHHNGHHHSHHHKSHDNPDHRHRHEPSSLCDHACPGGTVCQQGLCKATCSPPPEGITCDCGVGGCPHGCCQFIPAPVFD